MTQDELWKHFLKRNPNLEAENVSFTKEGLKKFFEATFQTGYEHGQMQVRAMEAMRKAVEPKASIFGDLSSIFGGKKNS